jgi:hypothetical protein
MKGLRGFFVQHLWLICLLKGGFAMFALGYIGSEFGVDKLISVGFVDDPYYTKIKVASLFGIREHTSVISRSTTSIDFMLTALFFNYILKINHRKIIMYDSGEVVLFLTEKVVKFFAVLTAINAFILICFVINGLFSIEMFLHHLIVYLMSALMSTCLLVGNVPLLTSTLVYLSGKSVHGLYLSDVGVKLYKNEKIASTYAFIGKEIRNG